MKIKHTASYHINHPNPTFYRSSYKLLNGKWSFHKDYDLDGDKRLLYKGFDTKIKINVPYDYVCESSKIEGKENINCVWYSRYFRSLSKDNKLSILHLDGSDYETFIYINGNLAHTEKGGYHRISVDITPYLNKDNNNITIKILDSISKEQVRGKQSTRDTNYECFYEQTIGLWKSVWLEYVNKQRIDSFKLNTCIECKKLKLDLDVIKENPLTLDIYVNNKLSRVIDNIETSNQIDIKFDNVNLWDEFNPYLYDLKLVLKDNGVVVDEVLSYFGFVKYEASNGKILINGREAYLRLILDQGYFDKNNLVATPKQLLKDIVLSKKMGFNGARKHEKIEIQVWNYYCDILGYYNWLEIPSIYEFSETSKYEYAVELPKIINQYYNHPSIMSYVIFNESWGLFNIKTDKEEQDFSVEMYDKVKEMDKRRFVISNDGWEHTKSDLLTLHHYEQNPTKLLELFDSLEKLTVHNSGEKYRAAYADGYKYNGEPILMTEFGGTIIQKDTDKGWGYGNSAANEEELLTRIDGFIEAIAKMPGVVGYCYTQLTDVKQEINGLLKENRKPKCKLKDYYKVFSKNPKN